jgi:DNA-entry nuclease
MPVAVAGALIARSVIPTAARVKTPAPPPAGQIVYGPLDHLGRATGASATITRAMLHSGTRAASWLKPPGFHDGASQHRAHLISKLLGGTGRDMRNLTTMFKKANTPVMRTFESRIAEAVRGGQVVRYQVTPIFRGNEPIARGVTLKAKGSGPRPLDLHITVLNIP